MKRILAEVNEPPRQISKLIRKLLQVELPKAMVIDEINDENEVDINQKEIDSDALSIEVIEEKPLFKKK